LDEQPQAFYVKDPMRVEVIGKFHQVAKFMYEVGKLDRVINMENVELVNPKVQGDEVELHSKALATAFHAPKPAGGAPK
jgi:type IV pilus assembly protein PilO